MSVTRRVRAWSRLNVPTVRTLALLATAGLLASVLSVLYGIVQVDGDPLALLLIAGAALLAATALASTVRVIVAVVVAAVLLSVGMIWYVLSLPYDPQLVEMVHSNLELLTGQSILAIEQSDVWALSVTPTPVFVIWYLAIREWYSVAAAVGGVALGYFVLTGDATVLQTLLGVVSVAALFGFGDLEHGDAPLDAAEPVAIVLAVMVIAPLLVTVTPAGPTTPLSLPSGGGGGGTIEASILTTDSQVDIVGDISLSPEIRYTVTAPESQFWRVSSYDRYTGDGWVRTGEAVSPDRRSLEFPPGQSDRVRQTYVAESPIRTMPAAWRPVEVSGPFANRTQVSSIGGLVPTEELQPGDSYQVTSAVPDVSPEELANAGSDDPAEIDERYTQLPASTPERVARRTANITAAASNRYETARTIERWLETNKEYSLDVDRPEGNVADAFLFEMERGYCTYYATTMVTMLRSQGVPARLTVGYTPGEEIGSDQFRVRGYNSHAWVEVYFPGHGWIPFDPTPAGPRQAVEQATLAQEQGVPNIATNVTNATTPTPAPGTNATTPTPTPTPTDPANLDDTTTPALVPAAGTGADEPDDTGFLPLPSREQLALGAVVLAGAVAGLRQSGLADRAYRAVWLRYLRRSDPETDIEAAFDRLLYLLERRNRPRRAGETVRQYLDDVDTDSRARRLVELRERARYGNEATVEMADEAVELIERIRREG